MKKRVACSMVAVLVGVTGIFAGCNFTNSGKEGGDIDVDVNENADVQLTVGILDQTSEQNVMATWINEFQRQHSNVNITISKAYSSMEQLPSFRGKDMPDICWTAGDQHSVYSQQGYFYDLSDETKFAGSSAFFGTMYDAVVDTTHYNEDDTSKWFVPRDYNRITIYYNKTVFQAMDIELPEDGWTWADFLRTCEKLTTTSNGMKCGKAISWPNWAPIHSTMMKNYGSRYVDEDGYCAFDSDETKALYNWYQSFYADYIVSELEGDSFRGYTPGSTTVNSAMFIATYAKLGTLLDAAATNKWELGTVAFPKYTDADNGIGYTGAGCSGYAITTDCTDEAERYWSWEFLKWCMSREGYDTVADIGVICPALKSMRNDGAWTKYGKDSINYHAFVDESTEDIDLNYQNVIERTEKQAMLIKMAGNFWKDAPTVAYKDQMKDFVESYKAIKN